MKTYTFNAVVGSDGQGLPVYREFVIQANSFREARSQLTELIKQQQ